MKSLCHCTLVFSILICSNLFGQEVTGIILDNSNKETLIGVNIILDDKGVASSDINGNFSIKTSEGSHSLTFKFIGYKDKVVNLNLSADEKKELVVEMSEDVKLIQTVVVSAGKFEQKIEENLKFPPFHHILLFWL